MKYFLSYLLLISALFAQAQVPAFNGAEGGGAVSVGGRGGVVIEVTNLNDSGTGSLRAALEASEPRIVIFKVAGIIELKSRLQIYNPYLTVAGQTAPGGGILIKGYYIDVYTHDCIFQYFRYRAGRLDNEQSRSFFVRDGAYNIIFDHLSISWGEDENFTCYSISNPTYNITLQWSMICEGLYGSDHNDHSAGAIFGSVEAADKVYNVSLHHNFFSNNSFRSPYIKNKNTELINNITYNWQWWSSLFRSGTTIDIIGNRYKKGPSFLEEMSWAHDHGILWDSEAGDNGNSGMPGNPSIYIKGNYDALYHIKPENDNWDMMLAVNNNDAQGKVPREFERTNRQTFSQFPVTIDDVNAVEATLLEFVGACRRLDENGNWVYNRDDVDKRLVTQYKNNTGKIISNISEVGGYPTIALGTPYKDTDHDGMPDTWEITMGLNPNNASDNKGDLDGDGFTNIEEFLNGNTTDTSPIIPTPDYAYEAENATIYKGVVHSNNQGFTGTGFVNYDNEIGSYVEWEVSSNTTGKTTLTFQYANGTDQNRAMEIAVNGKVVASNFAFNGTGSWETWAAQQLEIELQQGTNTIRATAVTENGGSNVDYLQVPPVEASKGNGTGLSASYFNNKTFSGNPVLSRTDTTINFSWGNGSPENNVNNDNFSARWEGQIAPQYSEAYTFETETDDGVRLWINDKKILELWQDMAPTNTSGTITLEAGKKYNIKIEYYESTGGAVAKLRWKSASQTYQIIPQSQLYPKNSNDVFQQNSSGLVEIEVENYHNYLKQGGHEWEEVSPIGFSGTAALKATPNTGVHINTGNLTNSPRLDYKVNFVKTGTHYIWTRGIGANGNDDSYHAGLDGTISTSADRISSFGTNWTWSKKTMDGPDATINVGSTGNHTFNIWMREDGFVIDKVVITNDFNYEPTDNNARIANFIAPEEGNTLELTLYPNPVTRLLTLEGIDFKGASLKITNVVGQVVLEKELRQSTIDFTSFSKGIYLIAIEKEGKIFKGKVMKE